MKRRMFLLVLTVMCQMFFVNCFAQDRVPFNGIVTDIVGQPLKRVKVTVTSTNAYTYSDRKGRFGLTDVKAEDTLRINYKKTEYLIPVGDKKSMKIRLADQLSYEAVEDQELVDLGYGFVKRREHTGASNGISGDELRRTGCNNVLEALKGRIPGLNVNSTGIPGDETTVNMRGRNSFFADQTPLFVVDGIVVETLMNINLYDVDYVEVLKDASIYGSRGANGAILVHTIKGLERKRSK